jgi:hypothetical protein
LLEVAKDGSWFSLSERWSENPAPIAPCLLIPERSSLQLACPPAREPIRISVPEFPRLTPRCASDFARWSSQLCKVRNRMSDVALF